MNDKVLLLCFLLLLHAAALSATVGPPKSHFVSGAMQVVIAAAFIVGFIRILYF